MTGRRVVITGYGAVTPLGNDLEATIAALPDGRCAFAPATRFASTAFGEARVAEVKAFSPREYFRAPKAIKLTDRAAQFAVAASMMALDEAGWPSADDEAETLGVAIGSSGSDLQAAELARAIGPDPASRAVEDIAFFAARILGDLHPLWLLVNLPNMVSAHVAIQCGARGPNTTIMTDWIAGSQAIGEAYDWIRRGDASAVLAGGADCGVHPFAYASYEQGGLLSANDDGDERRFVLGEGAGMLVLEDRERALDRGARVLGEIAGYATASAPVDDTTAVSGGALAETLGAALSEAAWSPAEVDLIVNASVFDRRFLAIERAALRRAIGSAPAGARAMEFTSRLGHALGAAGAIDAALAVALAVRSDAERGCRIVCNSIGYSGQAATLAIVVSPGASLRSRAS